jgi:hypothetical protein
MYLCNIVVLDTPYIFGSILKWLLFKFTWICPWIHFKKETTITLKGLTFWPNLYTDFEKNDTLGPMEMRCHDLHHWTLKFTTSVKWHAQHSCVSGRFRKYRRQVGQREHYVLDQSTKLFHLFTWYISEYISLAINFEETSGLRGLVKSGGAQCLQHVSLLPPWMVSRRPHAPYMICHSPWAASQREELCMGTWHEDDA